jgi:hypothetical protein
MRGLKDWFIFESCEVYCLLILTCTGWLAYYSDSSAWEDLPNLLGHHSRGFLHRATVSCLFPDLAKPTYLSCGFH